MKESDVTENIDMFYQVEALAIRQDASDNEHDSLKDAERGHRNVEMATQHERTRGCSQRRLLSLLLLVVILVALPLLIVIGTKSASKGSASKA